MNEVKDAVFLKLDKQFYGWANDIVLGSMYLSPEGSVTYTEGKSETEILENYILKLLNSCTEYHLLLVGDFNSRTGNMDDYILIDNTDSLPVLSETPHIRLTISWHLDQALIRKLIITASTLFLFVNHMVCTF